MAMGKRERDQQGDFWVATSALPAAASHPFYARVNQILADRRFDDFVEAQCSKFYHERLGRPSLAPGVYFRCLLVGYFEGLDSERGIAWRAEDSLGIRRFLGYALTDAPPDHSTISRTRRLIDVETHEAVFGVLRTATTPAGCGARICGGYDNILKRVLVHVAGFNLSLVMRKLLGAGTPHGLSDLAARIWGTSSAQLVRWDFIAALRKLYAPLAPGVMRELRPAA